MDNRSIRTFWALLALAAGCTGSDAAAAVFHVGPGCTYNTLAPAVAAAKANAGADSIALNTGTFAITQTVTVDDSAALTIEGGYASCSATVSTGSSTLDADTKSSAGSVIFHHAAGALTLQHLRIANNDTLGSYGGAVFSSQAGALTLRNVMLDHNRAYGGAGVHVLGTAAARGRLTLVDSRIEYCIADHSGGGIGAEQSDVTIRGDSEITINSAGSADAGDGDGGGIWLKNSSLQVIGHTEPGRQLLGSNTAERYGGGLYWEIQNSSLLSLVNDRADQPLVIENNAAPEGGGFYVRNSSTGNSSANVSLWNTIFSRNTATTGKGAALYLDAAGSSGAGVYATLRQSVAGDAIPACATGLECNAYVENDAQTGGSIIQAQHSAGGSVDLNLQRAYLRDNAARTGLVVGNGSVSVDNSLIAGNYIDYPYIYLLNVTSNVLSVSNTTIAGNVLHASSAAVYTNNGTLNFYHNLVDQPGAFVCIAAVPVAVTARDVGYTAGTSPNQCNGVNSKQVQPLFVDPANGDFHLSGYGSDAMDTWSASGNAFVPQLDLDGARRPVVIADQNRPYDYGAYEWGAVVDKIFVNGFEAL